MENTNTWEKIFENSMENVPGSRLGVPFVRAQQDIVEIQVNDKPLALSQCSLGVFGISGVVWDAGLLLIDTLVNLHAKKELSELYLGREMTLNTILDLGCGTGICGIAAIELGAQNVTFSDGIHTASLDENISGYQDSAKVNVIQYDWSQDIPPTLVQPSEDEPWDLILSSDVLYEEKSHNPLLKVLKSIKFRHLLLSYKRRHDEAESTFFRMLSADYIIKTIDLSTLTLYNLKNPAHLVGLHIFVISPKEFN